MTRTRNIILHTVSREHARHPYLCVWASYALLHRSPRKSRGTPILKVTRMRPSAAIPKTIEEHHP